MKTYKIRPKYILGNCTYFIFPLLMTIAAAGDRDGIQASEWIALGSFWLIGLIVILVFSVSKIEVGEDYVQPYLFGFSRKKICKNDVEVIEYGNLFRGGLGVGKGLKMRVRKSNGSRTYRSIGEKAYGTEAISDMQRALNKS